MFSRNSAKIIKNGTSEKKSVRSKSGENTGRLVTLTAWNIAYFSVSIQWEREFSRPTNCKYKFSGKEKRFSLTERVSVVVALQEHDDAGIDLLRC